MIINTSGKISVDGNVFKYKIIGHVVHGYHEVHLFNDEGVPFAAHKIPVHALEGQKFFTGGCHYKIIKKATTVQDFKFV